MTPESEQVLLPQAEMEIMKTAFQLFDRNADGTIDNYEFGTVIRAIGNNASNKQIQEALEKYDKNGDGVIDFNEFVLMAKEMEGSSKDKQDEALRQAFR